MKKRIFALLLIGALAVVLAACGTSSTGTSGEDANADAGQQAEAADQAEQEDEKQTDEDTEDQEEQEDADQKEDVSDQNDADENDNEDGSMGDIPDESSFWGTATIGGSIQDAYIDGNELVLVGSFDISSDDGEVLDSSDSGEHRFTISDDASLGYMGGTDEPEKVSLEEFGETLQYDVENNPGLGLDFYVVNGVIREVWIAS